MRKKKLVCYWTSEKPTSKVTLLAFETRSFVIFYYYFKKILCGEESEISRILIWRLLLAKLSWWELLFLANPPHQKKKLYTFPPSHFISLFCMPRHLWLKMKIFVFFFFSLYLKRGGEGDLAVLKREATISLHIRNDLKLPSLFNKPTVFI